MISNSNMSAEGNRFFMASHDPDSIPVLKLAFIGDAVYELLVREMLTDTEQLPFEKLNDAKKKIVCAQAQAAAAEKLSPYFTETEAAVFRHGRNAKHKTVPKSASPAEYGKATGFEALLGYLYLKGERGRILELWNIANSSKEGKVS